MAANKLTANIAIVSSTARVIFTPFALGFVLTLLVHLTLYKHLLSGMRDGKMIIMYTLNCRWVIFTQLRKPVV